MRLRGRGRAGILLAALLAAAAPGHPGPVDAVETSVQAAYLFQFTRFVEWPVAAASAPLTVCVVGRDPFGKALDLAVHERRVGRRRVDAVRLPDVAGAAACNVVFLPSAETARLGDLLRVVGRRPVLLVGDAPRFAHDGGMIGFFREDDRVRFEVNRAAAEGAGLRISSRLLDVARVAGGHSRGSR